MRNILEQKEDSGKVQIRDDDDLRRGIFHFFVLHLLMLLAITAARKQKTNPEDTTTVTFHAVFNMENKPIGVPRAKAAAAAKVFRLLVSNFVLT